MSMHSNGGCKKRLAAGMRRLLSAGLLAWLAASGPAQAGDVQVISKHLVAGSVLWETSPVLGSDALGPYLVYTQQAFTGTSFGLGDIVIQRLSGSAPSGSPLVISSPVTDDQLNDTYGGHVVYTAFDAAGSGVGQIMAYKLAESVTVTLPSVPGAVREARIHDTVVVWLEGFPGATRLQYWDLTWAGTGLEPLTINSSFSIPDPPATNIEIGSNYVVWDIRVGTVRQVWAFSRLTGFRMQVSPVEDTVVQHRLPATSGDWVVWEYKIPNAAPVGIMAKNLATGELRTIAEPVSQNFNPNIDGDFVTYESDRDGDFDIYLYRLSDGRTFQLTNDTGHQFLNNIHGHMVTYVSQPEPGLGLDVHVLAFTDQLPIANAGPDQTARPGTAVTLDGSASYHPAGIAIASYAWSVVSAPAGSAAQPSTPSAVSTGFTPDLPGDYVLSLVVSTQEGVASTPDMVAVSSTNVAPVADAGPDQAVTLVGATVTLNGGASYDLDGDPITHAWTLVARPADSTATLAGANTATPSFIADRYGEYRAQLVVSDPWVSSLPDVVTVSFTNLPPLANAGTNQTVVAGTTATLDGRNSSDPNGDFLSYRWSVVSSPAGSAPILGGAGAPVATLTPDLAGSYVVSLVVSDGLLDSSPSNVTVVALTQATQATQQTTQAMDAINALSLAAFKNGNMQNALTSKLQAVQADIAAGLYADALAKLTNDVIKKTDGCAAGGAVDANDWIKDCASQGQVYPVLLQAIALLRSLI